MRTYAWLAPALAGLLALAATACGGDGADGGPSGTIRVDGSSTVAPLSEAAAERFGDERSGVRVTVGTSGTGGGFEKFCRGETDISDASRRIEDEEIELCEKNGIAFEEVQVANDGLTVVINPGNDWAKCMTVEQVKRAWDRGSTASTWRDLDPRWPDEKLALFGPGTDSGTFDYFTEAIDGEEGRQRTDYNNVGEDDNATVTGVAGTKGGMGYLGLSFVQENEGKVVAAEIDGGDGCVAPSTETVQSGAYKPLARPLFIYPSDKALARPEVREFVRFYVDNQAGIAEQALYVPMNDEQAQKSKEAVEKLSGGGAS